MCRHIATALVLSSSIVVASDLQDDREPPRHQRTDPSVDAPEIVVATIAQASAAAVATDRHGNTYITGTTSRPDFPTTPDALKRVWDPAPVQNFCFTDAILVKLSAADRVVYATRFGGSDNDIGNAVAVDAAGNIFIAGTTWSADFPSRGAFMSARHAQQGFVAKFSPRGELLFATPMPTEGLTAVAVDDSGSIAVGGFAYVESASLTNPLQPVIRGAPDGFVAKLRHDVPAYVFASYLGGRGGDSVAAVALHDGCVYVAGATSSRDFPVTRAYQRVHGGGYNDGFVAAFAPDGRALQFSTYVGGSGEDAARGVAVAGDGAAYAIGRTDSADFPATDGAFDRRCGSDGRCNPTRVCDRRGYCATVPIPDIFVTSIDRVGGLRTSTFLGGGGNDEGRAIAVDASGRITIAGSTTSRDFDGIPPPLRCRAADGCHAFVAELSADLDVVTAAWRVPVPVRSGSDPVALARTRPDRLTITLNTSAGAVVVRAPSASGPIE